MSNVASHRPASGPAKSASDKAAAVTPMMAQFMEIKQANQGSLLFYRMGDFYEMFFDDAVIAASALDITLTKRGKHLGEDIPMCGVPVHSADAYLERLIRQGHRVAVCEQTESPAEAKKRGAKSVVRREVVRLVTPGTLTEDTLLDARQHNYLASLARIGASSKLGLSWADVSTGDFYVCEVEVSALGAELARLRPGELLVAENLAHEEAVQHALGGREGVLTPLQASQFDSARAERRLKDMFKVAALDAYGTFARAELAAAGALVDYLELTQVGRMPVMKAPKQIRTGTAMAMDAATRANLELTRTMSGDTKGALLATLDRTVTGPGARVLAERLNAPLTQVSQINRRQEALAFLLDDVPLRADLRAALKAVPDMARALSRLSLGRGGPRDLAAMKEGLYAAHQMASRLGQVSRGSPGTPPNMLELPEELQLIHEAINNTAAPLVDLLLTALSSDLPLLARDGGFIAKGYNPPLDECRALRDQSRQIVAGLQLKYAEETGITALKVKHNNVLGYHIDVPERHAAKLLAEPYSETYIHRQSLASAVRFTTVELSELATRIAEAGGRALALEQDLFDQLVSETMQQAPVIAEAADALAQLDVTAALAELAQEKRYSRPKVDGTLAFEIEAGRHPVVEAALEAAGQGPFVANGCDLSADKGAAHRLWLLTGPNMAGKSTFLRQNALIAIMAQMGSYVPAGHAHIGVVDQLFSRVGAADDLARGRSTFMVEMVETAAILNQASPHSLVILDEIGRGTATFDGLSIAWAAVEHLHEVNACRSLFATHYHELTSLTEKLPHLANATMKVKEWEGNVIFLHEVAPGAADRSYGIQVAKLAGLPEAVIVRAHEVLSALEAGNEGGRTTAIVDDLPLFSLSQAQADPKDSPAAKSAALQDALREAMDDIDPDSLTPREALDVLYALKQKALD
ncbi:MAG: DNA mismatch repair protein MutS [Parvibaculaceae bacterium]|nr:DNA mismatch repair protein MutS [Parvibaculaceae bacterium]